MIRMKGIRKEYHMGDNVLAALDGVDIHIKPHEFVSVSYTHLDVYKRQIKQ